MAQMIPAPAQALLGSDAVAHVWTCNPDGSPQVSVVWVLAQGDEILFGTDRASRKARNVAATGGAGVAIAVRRLPVGPPASIQFQCRAEVLRADDPEITRLVAAGRLRRVTSHGELELEGACFLRLPLPGRVHTYALGMSLWRVLRDPLDLAGEAVLAGPGGRGPIG